MNIFKKQLITLSAKSLLFVTVTLLCMQCGNKKVPPNVLFIAVDDLYASIGATKDVEGNFLKIIYPDPELRAKVASRLTPNIDRLAAQGRQFVNNTCQSPLCGPSRTSLLTGVPTHASGYYMHKQHFRASENLKSVVTLPQFLKGKGYFTTGIGKIFHSSRVKSETPAGDWPDTKYSWDAYISSGGGASLGGANLPLMSPRESNMKFGPGDEPKAETNDWKNSLFTSTLLRNGQATKQDIWTKKAITVTLPDNQPFFMASGIFRPHLPFYAPKVYFDLFPTSEMKIDEALFEWIKNDIEDLPPAGTNWTQLTKGKFFEVISQGERVAGKEGQLEAWKQCVQAYLACAAFADDCVGEILDGLEGSKYKNNTIVVLWSDHGYFMGDKARIAKQCLWWESIKSNLIIKLPNNQLQRGIPSNEFVQLTDLYATIASLCGFEKPKHVMGEDISPLVIDPMAKLQRAYTYSTYMKGNHCIFNDQYKYIRYQNGDIELYDVRKDILELDNLAKDSTYQKTIKQLDAELESQLANGMKYLVASKNEKP